MILNFFKSSYSKVKSALAKTGSLLGSKIRILFQKPIDGETLGKLEQLFYEADLGPQIAKELTQKTRVLYQENPSLSTETLIASIRHFLIEMLDKPTELNFSSKEEGPTVILVIGVNGNGKTTSVAKIANKLQENNKKVLVAAADTFRAAATEQLAIWAQQLQIDIVKGSPKSDPASVVFDALNAAKSRNIDVVIIDTAGRLHTKTNLMQELEKIKRTCRKFNLASPHETLLVVDATTGQNAVDQARTFNQYTPISGIVLTKLDGTAKGGIAISIQKQLGIPIKFIGVGETIEDLQPFDSEQFVNALFE
jgi:fused signal recognition particle receptor